MGIFETIMGIATLAETKGTRDEIAAHQAAIDRIEKGMSTKEDITSVLGCLASLKRDTSYLHTEVMFAGAGVPVSFDQAGLMRRYDPKMLQNGTPQMPAGNSGAPTSMYPQTPIVPTMTPYGMQQLVQQTPVQAQIPSGNPVASRTTASPSENKNMMVQSIVCGDDIRYFAQQPQSELTLIVGQMTSLLESISDLKRSTDSRVERLQNQGWFKRMWNTITGKNKATKEEIRRNQDKIVGYISESVAQLYKMNLIELQVMQSIGNRINQVYAQLTEVYNEQLQMRAQITEIQEIQQQTIRSLGEIANTLDEKIESIDNFHLLITEIQQKKYKNSNQLYGLCCVLAQLDRRTT